MTNEEIIGRLERMAAHAVHTVGEEPYVLGLDDGIALCSAIEALNAHQPRVITLEELKDEAHHCFDVVWYEVKGGNVIPRRVQPFGPMLKVKSFYAEPFLSDARHIT